MGRLIAQQLVSALRSWRLGVIAALAVLLCALQYVTVLDMEGPTQPASPTLLRFALLFTWKGRGMEPYLVLLPFLASLLGGSTYANERFTGRLALVAARVGHRAVLLASMVSGFVLGCIGGVLPLLASLLFGAVQAPHLPFIDGRTDVEVGYPLITASSWAYPLYCSNRVLLLLAVTLLVAVTSGCFAVLSVGVSMFTTKRHTEVVVPFCVTIAVWYVPAIFPAKIDVSATSHIIYLFVAACADPLSPWYAGATILLLLAGAAGCWLVRRNSDVVVHAGSMVRMRLLAVVLATVLLVIDAAVVFGQMHTLRSPEAVYNLMIAFDAVGSWLMAPFLLLMYAGMPRWPAFVAVRLRGWLELAANLRWLACCAAMVVGFNAMVFVLGALVAGCVHADRLPWVVLPACLQQIMLLTVVGLAAVLLANLGVPWMLVLPPLVSYYALATWLLDFFCDDALTWSFWFCRPFAGDLGSLLVDRGVPFAGVTVLLLLANMWAFNRRDRIEV